MTFLHPVRWVLVPVSAMGACAGALTAADIVRRASIPATSVEGVVRLDVRVGLGYAIAAALFVVVGAMVAPKHRLIVSIFLYALGATVAWYGLNDWYFPEHHPRAYQPSRIPVGMALSGGVIAVLGLAAWLRRHGKVGASLPAHSSTQG